MTQSPKKYASHFTSSTTNRGVEAKEVEIANTHLDINASGSTQYQESADIDIRSQASGDTGSYLQVVVQKHKRKDPIVAATQTSPRLPVASSPIKKIKNGSGDTQLYLFQQPMLLAYPPNPQPHATNNVEKPEVTKKLSTVKEELVRQSFWSKFQEITKDTSPDRVEMYYFERTTGDFLSISDGVFTYTEQFALKSSRITNRIVAECFAIPQIILSIPVSVILHTERTVLKVLRSFLVGTVQILSDYVLKPVLTLSFNAVIQPPLVFVGNVVRAVREAVRPVALLIGDFVEPLVKVLGAIRLVNVEGSHVV
ncbi:hypothetical protein MSG28_015010 [Choristoneura fumiferana]|uniref:Uncharacterized protein n=1 Tax=Choristoneura fumiferana TaxID=7141 RepID=A0ACC0KYM1_CHOFU|nr:hypothetical protein MSG28_015010 [Choristoneura fumiferana]